VKGPGVENMLDWISKGMTKLTRNAIQKSFEYTGFTTRDPEKFHTTLKNIVQKNLIPIQNAISLRTDIDHDSVAGVFVEDNVACFESDDDPSSEPEAEK
jgi:hypothetical protein